MATGTGKTFIAMQIAWKLWKEKWPTGERPPRILYLADRNILIDQPIQREFKPAFGDAVYKIQGEMKTGREIYFALYQSLADSGTTSESSETTRPTEVAARTAEVSSWASNLSSAPPASGTTCLQFGNSPAIDF